MDDSGRGVAAVARAAEGYLWRPWSRSNQDRSATPVLVQGRGCVVTDADGRTYLDGCSGTLNASCGYGCEEVVEAATAQMRRLMSVDLGGATSAPAALLAERYAELLPEPLERTFFVGSGSEATEAAIKMARMLHWLRGDAGRRTILSLADGYHGATLGALAASHAPIVQTGNAPLPPDFEMVATPTGPDAGELEETISRLGAERVAALIVEPVLGVGGVIIPHTDYLRRAREMCSRAGAVLIFDEVFTGFGRTGKMFALEHSGVVPDIVTSGKGVSGGYVPLAAVTAATWIYDEFANDPLIGGFRHGHTTSGHPVACAAALAAIGYIESKDLVQNAACVGVFLRERLEEECAAAPAVRAIRGLGLMIGIELKTEALAMAVATRSRDLGLLVRQQAAVITLAPPLTLTTGLAAEMAGIVGAAMATTRGMAGAA